MALLEYLGEWIFFLPLVKSPENKVCGETKFFYPKQFNVPVVVSGSIRDLLQIHPSEKHRVDFRYQLSFPVVLFFFFGLDPTISDVALFYGSTWRMKAVSLTVDGGQTFLTGKFLSEIHLYLKVNDNA